MFKYYKAVFTSTFGPVDAQGDDWFCKEIFENQKRNLQWTGDKHDEQYYLD